MRAFLFIILSLSFSAYASIDILNFILPGAHKGFDINGEECWVFVHKIETNENASLTISKVNAETRPAPGESTTFTESKAAIINREADQTSLKIVQEIIPNDSYSRTERAALQIRKFEDKLEILVETKSKFLFLWVDKIKLTCNI
jgi:hypothetical protein